MPTTFPLPRLSELPERNSFIERPFDNIFLRDYYYALSKRHGYIRFLGLPIGRDPGGPIKIDRLFVEPLLGDHHVTPEEMDEVQGESSLHTIVDAFRKDQKLVILGDPGAGKSTLIHWLVDVFSSPEPHPLVTLFGRMIPIPFVLREISVQLTQKLAFLTWEDLLKFFLDQPLAGALSTLPRDVFEGFFKSGQALILLDGLDEVPHEARQALRNAVWEGFEKAYRCRWVMTSRLVGYDQCPFDSSGSGPVFGGARRDLTVEDKLLSATASHERSRGQVFAKVFYTVPFDDRQLKTFANFWYRHFEPEAQLADRAAAEFLEAIDRNRGTRALARIPNLVTLMALIYRQYARLPDGRAVLYHKITEAYLESIDEARRLRFHSASPLSRVQKERWLSQVAFEMQKGREPNSRKKDGLMGLLISREHLLKSLADYIQDNANSRNLTEGRAEAERILAIIAERSGLLLPRGGDDRFGFLHLSFQEYFAALHLRRAILARGWEDRGDSELGPKALKQKVHHEVWTETLLLLFELLGEHEGWSEHIIKLLFKEELRWVNPNPRGGIAFMPLSVLIAISLDTQTGLDNAFRKTIWTAGWRVLLETGGFGQNCAGDPAGVLLRPSDYREQIIDWGITLVSSGKIRKLDLNNSGKYPELKSLMVLSPIDTLEVFGWKITPEIADAIISLSRLRTLKVDVSLETKFLRQLVHLSSLSLNFSRGEPNDEVWANIKSLKGLRSLSIFGFHGSMDFNFLKSHDRLKFLYISGAIRITNFEAISKIRDLEEITLKIEERVNLAPLCEIPSLKKIRLYQTEGPIELASIASRVEILLELRDVTVHREERWFPDRGEAATGSAFDI